MLHWENYALPWIDCNIYALPQSTGDPVVDAQQVVFNGLFYIFLGLEITNTSHYPLSLDNAPGGMWDMFSQLYADMEYIDGDDFLVYSNHCFVPTVSSLGIPINYIDTDLSANPDVLALSPFDEVHTALGNEMHTEINPRNKRWFMRAILEGIDSDNDGLNDYQEYLIGTDYASTSNSLHVAMSIIPAFSAAVPAQQPQPAGSPENDITLIFNAMQNIQYSIWFTESLARPWILLDTIPPFGSRPVTNTYGVTNPFGFFKSTGEIIDPATD